jgi:hypothetical protein
MPMHCYLWTNDSQTGAELRSNITPAVLVYWQGGTTPEALADKAYDDAEALGRPGRIAILHRKLLEEGYTGVEKANACDIRTAYTMGLSVDQWRDRTVRFWARWKSRGPLVPRIVYADLEAFISGQVYGWHVSRGADWPARAALLAQILDDDQIRPLLPPRIQKYRSADYVGGWGAIDGDKYKAFYELEHLASQQLSDAIRKVLADPWSRVMPGPLPIMHNYDDAIRDMPYYDHFATKWPPMALSVNGAAAPECYPTAEVSGVGIYAGKSKNQRYNRMLYSLGKVMTCAPRQIIMPWMTDPRRTGLFSNPPTNTIPIYASNAHGQGVMCKALGALGIGETMGWAPGIPAGDLDLWNANLEQVTVTNPPSKRPALIPLDADGFQIGNFVYTYNAADWAWT